MSDTGSSTVCGDCNAEVSESADPCETPTICRSCGSKNLIRHLFLADSAKAYDGFELKGKRPGKKKPYLETKSGPSHSRKLGKVVQHERRIDRDADHYSEKVTDYETGEVIHRTDEPLSEHQGHGSAKEKQT